MVLDVRQSQSPRLADGTSLEDAFDLAARKIAGNVFADPLIYRVELERVFARSWCFVGFESEIPGSGDYVTRPMGNDSVLLTRDSAGSVNVLLNSCTHRGTQLSVIDKGSCEQFKCPYHGWIFDTTGRLDALIAERERLGPDGSKDAFHLRRARVSTYAGMIFATWNRDAPDLDAYLGDAKWYMDLPFRSVDDSLVVTGPPHRWTVRCNWKFGAENFAGDVYHVMGAHASAATIGLVPPSSISASLGQVTVADTTWGHGVTTFNIPRSLGGQQLEQSVLRQLQFPWLPEEVLPQLENHLNDGQLELLQAGEFPGVGNIFPNFSWIMQASPFGPLALIRTWHPVGPGQVEVWSWSLAHPDASDELRHASIKTHARLFGMAGMLEEDDVTIWSRMQRAREGYIGGQQQVDYSCRRQPDKSRYVPDGRDWPGPGTVWQGRVADAVADDAMWNFYLRWYQLMTEPCDGNGPTTAANGSAHLAAADRRR